jgi:hypothetical protein
MNLACKDSTQHEKVVHIEFEDCLIGLSVCAHQRRCVEMACSFWACQLWVSEEDQISETGPRAACAGAGGANL